MSSMVFFKMISKTYLLQAKRCTHTPYPIYYKPRGVHIPHKKVNESKVGIQIGKESEVGMWLGKESEVDMLFT